MSCVRGRLGRWTQDAEIKLKSLLMKSFSRKITNRNLKSQKQEAYTGDAADGSSGETGYKDTEQQDTTTTIRHKGEHRDLYTHREGRGNWPQVEHMRTGADNHRQEGKKENTLEKETTK